MNPPGKKGKWEKKGKDGPAPRPFKNAGKELVPTRINMDKFYEKDIDELLDDSNWDINSFTSEGGSMGKSLGESDSRVWGLESIYL